MVHAINRNKESLDRRPQRTRQGPRHAARSDRAGGRDDPELRPGVIERQGFGWEDVRAINSPDRLRLHLGPTARTDHGRLAGAGPAGAGASGLPVADGIGRRIRRCPWALAVADMLAGNALALGLLAALVGRGAYTAGAPMCRPRFSRSMIDFQFEVLTTHLNERGAGCRAGRRGDGRRSPPPAGTARTASPPTPPPPPPNAYLRRALRGLLQRATAGWYSP